MEAENNAIRILTRVTQFWPVNQQVEELQEVLKDKKQNTVNKSNFMLKIVKKKTMKHKFAGTSKTKV